MKFSEYYNHERGDVIRHYFDAVSAQSADSAWKLRVCFDKSDHWFLTLVLDALEGTVRSFLYRSFPTDPGFASGGEDPWVRVALEYYDGDVNKLIEGTAFQILQENPEPETAWGKLFHAIRGIGSKLKMGGYYILFAKPTTKIIKCWDVRDYEQLKEMMAFLSVVAVLRDTVKEELRF